MRKAHSRGSCKGSYRGLVGLIGVRELRFYHLSIGGFCHMRKLSFCPKPLNTRRPVQLLVELLWDIIFSLIGLKRILFTTTFQ